MEHADEHLSTRKRKLYEAPKLIRYGELTEVTRNLGGGTKNDHARGNTKT